MKREEVKQRWKHFYLYINNTKVAPSGCTSFSTLYLSSEPVTWRTFTELLLLVHSLWAGWKEASNLDISPNNVLKDKRQAISLFTTHTHDSSKLYKHDIDSLNKIAHVAHIHRNCTRLVQYYWYIHCAVQNSSIFMTSHCYILHINPPRQRPRAHDDRSSLYLTCAHISLHYVYDMGAISFSGRW